MPVEDIGKCARLVTLQIRVHVVNYVVNYGVDKSTYLTDQEHLQHAWDITFQHPGQLAYHTNTVHKYNISMLLTQGIANPHLHSTLDKNLSFLHDIILAEYLFLCLIYAHGKTPLLRFHQLPPDPGQIESNQNFYVDPSFLYLLTPGPSKQGQQGPDIDKCGLDVLTGHKVSQHKDNNVTNVLNSSKPYFFSTSNSLLEQKSSNCRISWSCGGYVSRQVRLKCNYFYVTNLYIM